MSRYISRRTWLRGAAGGATAAIALPTLNAMLNGNGTAYANGAPLPVRFGVWWWGDGVRLGRWNPKAVGAGSAWELSEELAPLSAVKSHIAVVSGTMGPGGGHHGGAAGMTTGAPYKDQGPHPAGGRIGTVSRPSIDQVVAASLGKTTRLRSLEVGVCTKVISDAGTVLSSLSHNGPDNPNPAERNPQAVFSRLFGAAGPGSDGKSELRRQLKGSVLDLVRTDATRLQARLGAEDRTRIDQHLAAIRSLEKLLTPAAPTGMGTCGAPTPPEAWSRPDNDEARLKATNLAMGRLTALALACDLTRVFTFHFSSANDHTTYGWLGSMANHHKMTHDEAGDQPIVHKSVIWKMERLAEFITALASMPEGGGSLLDRCAIMATSDVSDGRLHARADFPMIVIGRAGGKLRNDMHYRSMTAETTMKVHLTLLRAVGVDTPGFGSQNNIVGYASETLGALEA